MHDTHTHTHTVGKKRKIKRKRVVAIVIIIIKTIIKTTTAIINRRISIFQSYPLLSWKGSVIVVVKAAICLINVV